MPASARQVNTRVAPKYAPNAIELGNYQDFGKALERGRDDIVYFAEKFLGMPLHEGQKRFLRDATEKTNTLVPANRWGKTTVIAIKHIHHCTYKIGVGTGNMEAWAKSSYTTVNLSPHSDTTRPVFEAILEIMNSSFVITELDHGVKTTRTNECIIGWMLGSVRTTVPLYISFTNNTDILFRSTGEDQGKSIEGRSYGYISYDEGGQSGHLEYERTRRILPRLGQMNGQFDLVSTPELSSPSILEHYDLFLKGGGQDSEREEGFYSQEGSILENTFFLASNPDYVNDMQLQMRGNPILDQILYGKFVFSGNNMYLSDEIQFAKDDALSEGVAYEEGHHYIIGVDTSVGRQDEMVYTVLDITERPYRVVRQMACKGNSKSPQVHMADFDGLVRHYLRLNNLRVMLETWNGESLRFYKDIPYDLQFITTCWGSAQPDGMPAKVKANMRTIKKEEITLSIRKLLAEKALKIPNERGLVNQLSIYREDDKNLQTDRVISLALACWLATDGAIKHNNEVVEVEY